MVVVYWVCEEGEFVIVSNADLDISGQRFGKLLAIKCIEKVNYTAKWLCQCDCGCCKITRIDSLLSGRCKSCGCLIKEKKVKHGGAKNGKTERLYGVWQHMKGRCYNQNNEHYDRYGGRGITVCNEWLHDYNTFREWALNNGYNKNAKHGECTLDRIDNNKGYSPDNCRWVNMRTQDNNKSTNKYYQYNGESHTLSEWSDILGVKCRMLEGRIEKGWDFTKAIETEKCVAPLYEYNGGQYTIGELAKMCGINRSTLYGRLHSGYSVENAIKTPVKTEFASKKACYKVKGGD